MTKQNTSQKNPDLEGCMAQGATQEDAIENLADARYELHRIST